MANYANDSFWNDLSSKALEALMLYFVNRQGNGSGSTPNFYPVPLSPEEKRWDDAKWDTYRAGGSPQAQAVFAAGKQYLEQIPSGPQNFSFLSPEMKGQSFAGGMQFPKFDFSKINFGAPIPGGPKSTTPEPPEFRSPRDDLGDAKRPTDPLSPASGGGPYGLSPYGLDHIPGTITGGGSGAGLSDADYGQLYGYWQDWKTKHPNWARLGVNAFVAAAGAAFGLPGAAIAQALRFFLMREGQSPLPTPTQGYGDLMGKSPGVAGSLPEPSGNFGDLMARSPGVAGGPNTPRVGEQRLVKDTANNRYIPVTWNGSQWVASNSMIDASWSKYVGQNQDRLASMGGPQPPGYQQGFLGTRSGMGRGASRR